MLLWKLRIVYKALRVRDAREVVRSECAWEGRPICLRLCSRLFGIALNGPLVSSCNALDSCLSVVWSGCINDAFQERTGKDCWLYTGMDASKPSPSDLM